MTKKGSPIIWKGDKGLSIQPAKRWENSDSFCHSHWKPEVRTLLLQKKLQKTRNYALGKNLKTEMQCTVNKTLPITSTFAVLASFVLTPNSKLLSPQVSIIFPFCLKKRLMAPASRKDLDGLKIAVTVMLFFFLTFFPSKSGEKINLKPS